MEKANDGRKNNSTVFCWAEILHDYIKKEGGVNPVVMNKQICSQGRSRYHAHLREEGEKKGAEKGVEKRKASAS